MSTTFFQEILCYTHVDRWKTRTMRRRITKITELIVLSCFICHLSKKFKRNLD